MKRYTGQSLSRLSKHHKIKSYKNGGLVEDDSEDSGPSVSVGGGDIPKGVSGPGNTSRVSGVAGGASVNVPVGDYKIGVGVDYSKVKVQGQDGDKTYTRGGVNQVSVSKRLGKDSEVSLTYGRNREDGVTDRSLRLGFSKKF